MALVWEPLTIENAGGIFTPMVSWAKRAKVPGGWLVVVHMTGVGGVTFYPDPDHRWDGGSLP